MYNGAYAEPDFSYFRIGKKIAVYVRIKFWSKKKNGLYHKLYYADREIVIIRIRICLFLKAEEDLALKYRMVLVLIFRFGIINVFLQYSQKNN